MSQHSPRDEDVAWEAWEVLRDVLALTCLRMLRRWVGPEERRLRGQRPVAEPQHPQLHELMERDHPTGALHARSR